MKKDAKEEEEEERRERAGEQGGGGRKEVFSRAPRRRVREGVRERSAWWGWGWVREEDPFCWTQKGAGEREVLNEDGSRQGRGDAKKETRCKTESELKSRGSRGTEGGRMACHGQVVVLGLRASR